MLSSPTTTRPLSGFSERSLCYDLVVDSKGIFAKTGLHHQLLQVFELCLHLSQLLLQLAVPVSQSLQLLLGQVLLALLLLAVPEGGRPVLGLLPLLLVCRVGAGLNCWLGSWLHNDRR